MSVTWVKEAGRARWTATAGGWSLSVEKAGGHWFRPWADNGSRGVGAPAETSLAAAKKAAEALASS